jgi:hypothetical protein
MKTTPSISSRPSISKLRSSRSPQNSTPIGDQKIVVLGPRSVGKTTYVTALVHLAGKSQGNTAFYHIKYSSGEDSEELKKWANDQLLKGKPFERTDRKDVFTIPSYDLCLEFKQSQKWSKKPRPGLSVNFLFEDYDGEIFEELSGKLPDRLTGNDDSLESFMKKCLMPEVQGCLILLDHCMDDPDPSTGQDKDWDTFYQQCMKGFYQQVSNHQRGNDLRVAVALSKCERGEIWPSRLEPELDIFRRRLPNTHNFLRQNFPQLSFYALSAFGVREQPEDLRPNRKSSLDRSDTLVDPQKWQPYGLVSPLYWLCTGQTLPYDL